MSWKEELQLRDLDGLILIEIAELYFMLPAHQKSSALGIRL